MNFSQLLDRLADNAAYSGGRVVVRWGQLLRETPALRNEILSLATSDHLASLGGLGNFHSGVVTRANGFFIVRELPFDEIPRRMHVTRQDLNRIAVVMDAMGVVHKVEREHLRSVIKGPEQLESAFVVRPSMNRLFDVRMSKDELTNHSHTGALAYLKRGETVEFTTSEDSLKQGIPALRSQVKNRRPNWYSLQGIRAPRARIVVPEHIDKRYVFTLVPAENDGVVIDTLYVYEPHEDDHARLIHIGMNSLLTWYQVELRGRSQHGEGVLKVKLPDYRGIYIWNADALDPILRQAAVEAFAKLEKVGTGHSLDELGEPKRDAFELAYLAACGFSDPQGTADQLSRELRALAAERVERRLSVVDAKVSRRKVTNVGASVDAYAAKLASVMRTVPDPRDFASGLGPLVTFEIEGSSEGKLEVGSGLFDNGVVTAGGVVIARTGTVFSAEMVRAALMLDRTLRHVALPQGPALEQSHYRWADAREKWHVQFEVESVRITAGIHDPRTRDAVRQTALKTLKAIE
jgi:hypothetical protein